ncbi:hypothetical protein Glove_40g28 [Diversispora epigaea]|uniref:Uncharacterized protein n=1 Tax=Diversispora epigaea TaxID=1348612 RepID=A0A397JQG0_9GLOM|nr:hypothetical protein Glove_40g28 [Diversispora epigaea]
MIPNKSTLLFIVTTSPCQDYTCFSNFAQNLGFGIWTLEFDIWDFEINLICMTNESHIITTSSCQDYACCSNCLEFGIWHLALVGLPLKKSKRSGEGYEFNEYPDPFSDVNQA